METPPNVQSLKPLLGHCLVIRELTVQEFPLILPLIGKHNSKIPPEELQVRPGEMTSKG